MQVARARMQASADAAAGTPQSDFGQCVGSSIERMRHKSSELGTVEHLDDRNELSSGRSRW